MTEYRCLWFEEIASRSVPFSGKVGDWEATLAEFEHRRKDQRHANVCIEARESTGPSVPWPHPWNSGPLHKMVNAHNALVAALADFCQTTGYGAKLDMHRTALALVYAALGQKEQE
jgi:hypothetical protein